MSSEIRAVIVNSFRGTGEAVADATKALISYQNDPNSIYEFINVLKTDTDFQVQKSAAIYIKKILNNYWKKVFVGNEDGENIKNQLLEAMSLIQNREVIQNLIYTMDSIFDTDADTWNEMIQFIIDMSEGTEEQIAFDLLLCQHYISHFSEGAFMEHVPFMIEFVQRAFTIQNENIIVNASGLTSMIIRFMPLENLDMVAGLYQTQIELFVQSLTKPSFSSDMALRLEFSFEAAMLPIEPDILLISMLDFYESAVQSEEYTRNSYVRIFDVITELANEMGREIVDVIPRLIPLCLNAAAQTFEGGSFDQEEDAYFIVGAIEAACKANAGQTFYETLKECMNFDDESMMAVSMFALSRCIETLGEPVMRDIRFVMEELLMPALESEVLCAREAAVRSLEDIGMLLQDGQDDIGDLMLRTLIVQLNDAEDESLLSHALESISKVLINANIGKDLIEELLEKLIGFITEDIAIADAMGALSALIFSADRHIVDYVEDIFQLIVEGAQVGEEQSKLKQNSIEALGNLLRFCSELLGSDASEVIELIISSAQTDDLEIRSAVVVALENLIIINSPLLNDYKDEINLIAESAFDLFEQTAPKNGEEEEETSDDSDYEDDEEIGVSQNQIRFITDGILLVKNIFKFSQQLIPENPERWIELCLKIMDCSSEDLISVSTLASTWIWIYLATHEEDPSQFYKALLKNLEEKSSLDLAIGAAFRAFSRFLEKDIVIPDEVLDAAFEFALNFQKEIADNEEAPTTTQTDRNTNLFRFFAAVATKTPQRIGAQFIDQCTAIISNLDGNFEKSLCIGVLRQFYISCPEISTILRKTIIKMFAANLEICDFQVIPEPILALRNVFEREPQALENFISDIVDFCIGILEADDTRELHFRTTQADAISLLITFAKGEAISPEDVIDTILEALPVRGDDMEAEYIYSSLLEMLADGGAENSRALRAMAASLALSQQVIDSWKLSEKTYRALINFVKAAMQFEGAEEALEEAFEENEEAKERFQSRIE